VGPGGPFVGSALVGRPDAALTTSGDALEVEVTEALVGHVGATHRDPAHDPRRSVRDVDAVEERLPEDRSPLRSFAPARRGTSGGRCAGTGRT
jgi:hypothetical protein